MEKRVLLAISISLLFLISYSSIVQRTPKNKKEGYFTYQSVNKEDAKHEEEVIGRTTVPPVALIVSRDKSFNFDASLFNGEFNLNGGSLDRLNLGERSRYLPVTGILKIFGQESFTYSVNQIGQKIIMENVQDGLLYRKIYLFNKGNNLINCEIQIINNSALSKKLSLDFYAFEIDSINLDKKLFHDRDRPLFEYSIASLEKIVRKDSASKFSEKEKVSRDIPVKWVGFRDRYYALIVKPLFENAGYDVSPDGTNRLKVVVKSKEIELKPSEQRSYQFVLYFGPQDINSMKGFGQGFEGVVSFSNFGIINWLAFGIYFSIEILHKFIGNWGICIILISILIYLILYPLTIKSMMSMKKMQNLQPKINKLKEQHANNPQKLNKEVMELYKENKVNPLGGCLPIILQMPIFIGLYQVLWRAFFLKGASFLWIKDLSEPDRLYIFPFSLPIIGNELNILPIAMMLIMFVQQKITTKNMILTDESQVTQQRIMTTFFPIFLGFIFYKFSSGLTIYFTVFYLFSVFSQLKMSKVK